MNAPAVVRPYQNTDLRSASQALVDVHRTDGYPVEGVQDPENWIASPGVIRAWVAEQEGNVVGHIALMSSEQEDSARVWRDLNPDDPSGIAAVARLFVVQSARGQSLGNRLLRTAMQYAEENSVRLVLDVMLKDRAAIRLYEAAGWKKIGQAEHRHGDGGAIPAACYTWP